MEPFDIGLHAYFLACGIGKAFAHIKSDCPLNKEATKK